MELSEFTDPLRDLLQYSLKLKAIFDAYQAREAESLELGFKTGALSVAELQHQLQRLKDGREEVERIMREFQSRIFRLEPAYHPDRVSLGRFVRENGELLDELQEQLIWLLRGANVDTWDLRDELGDLTGRSKQRRILAYPEEYEEFYGL